ncbi:MAG: sigma-70 family RNA polymerase sigma factor, partial [Coriobacteriales bacterium]|nr:sigma-70 family RNA polymerase sigma factor [Coriobacteriales bacterium]
IEQITDDHAEQNEELDDVDVSLDFLKATEKLSDRDRRIIVYKVFTGLSHAEIAQLTHMSYSAVRTRYRRALKQIEAYYDQRSM